jgi:hypothetical protein
MSNKKDSPLDNLQNEIAKEKFSALRRISETLSMCLQELEIMDGKITKAIQDDCSTQEINKMIEMFNGIREDAEEWRYYLIVTREASGLFHSNMTDSMYKIPPKKKKIGEKKKRDAGK